MKSGFYKTASDNQLRGWTESQAKPGPRRGHGHCLLGCCPSDPLEPSEPRWNHDSWEVRSASQWDAPKTATLAAGIGQQKNEHDSSPQHHLTTGHTTNASRAESMDHETLPHLPYSPDLSPTDYHFLQASQPLFVGKMLSTTSRRQQMLSKSSLKPKARIFMLQE